MSGRYLRANTLPGARCSSCREHLLFLRWGHEERCERFVRAKRFGRVAIGAALLVLTLLLCVPS